VLTAGTIGGAKTALIGHETGSLEAGKKADFLVLDMSTVAFTPLNDIRNHLVYCENGSSIESVYVNGEKVVEHGRLTKVNEAELLAELRALMPEFLAEHSKVEDMNRALEPFFAMIHKRCNLVDLGIHRLGSDDAWRG
jgi:5-methylthioadenosine/S-adenosylhomocysteine deaminase